MSGGIMIRTIEIGSCVLIQGILVRDLQNGHVAVRVGDQTFVGRPVPSHRPS